MRLRSVESMTRENSKDTDSPSPVYRIGEYELDVPRVEL